MKKQITPIVAVSLITDTATTCTNCTVGPRRNVSLHPIRDALRSRNILLRAEIARTNAL